MEKQWAGALLSVKCCFFVQNHRERVTYSLKLAFHLVTFWLGAFAMQWVCCNENT